MIKAEDVGKMVTIVSCPLRMGGHIEIKCPVEEARWLTALFTRDANPFKTLANIGIYPSPNVSPSGVGSGTK